MEASKTLLKPFLDGVLVDIRDLFPEHDFSLEGIMLDSMFANCGDIEIVHNLSKIGKAMEKSLITGERFSFSWSAIPHLTGSELPSFLGGLWEELFFSSGTPVFRDANTYGHTCELAGNTPVYTNSSTCYVSFRSEKDQIDAATNRKACCVLCLRQFFLGLSKLTSLECLQLGRAGDFRLQKQAHEATKCLIGLLRSGRCCKEVTLVVVLRGRRPAPGASAIPGGPFWLSRTRCRV